MRRLSAVFLLSVPLVGQQLPPKAEIIRVFQECADDTQMRKVNEEVMASVRPGQIDALQFSSPLITVSHTDSRVKKERPECSSGRTSVTDDGKRYFEVMAKTAAFADTIGAGGIASATTSILYAGYVLSGAQENNTHQETAVCGMVCALVPDHMEQLPKGAKTDITYYSSVNGRAVSRNDEEDYSDWSHFDLPITLIEGKIPAKSGMGTEDATLKFGDGCKTTLVCTRLRNWSHTTNRAGFLTVALPIDAVSRSCVDYSVLNRNVYENVIYKSIKEHGGLLYYENMITTNTCKGNSTPPKTNTK